MHTRFSKRDLTPNLHLHSFRKPPSYSRHLNDLDHMFLKESVPLPGEDEVDFCMVDDPFASLNRGSTVRRTQLTLLIRRPDEHEYICVLSH